MSDRDDNDVDSPVERLVRQYFDQDEQIPGLAVDHAKALFGLRDLDAELLELTDELVATRGDDTPEAHRFENDRISLVVRSIDSGIEITSSDLDASITLESSAGRSPVVLDAAGRAVIDHHGPARLHIEFPDGSTAVSDPFTG